MRSSERRRPSRRNAWLALGIFALGAAVVYFAMVSLAQPAKYDIKIGEVSPQTITATKDVVDELATEQRREEARSKTAPIRYKDHDITANIEQSIKDVFTAVEEARVSFAEYRERMTHNQVVANPEITPEEIHPDASLITKLRNTLTPLFSETGQSEDDLAKPVYLNDRDLRAMLEASEVDFVAVRDNVQQMVATVLEDGLREEGFADAVLQLRNRIYYEFYGIPNELRPFAIVIFTDLMRPNEFIDETRTEQAREEAAEAVEPVTYQKGQNIAIEGEPVRENQLMMLEALGLLKESERPDLTLYLGMGILTLLLSLVTAMNLWDVDKAAITRPKRALLIAAAVLIQLVASLAVRQIDAYLMPMHLALMVLAVLTSPSIAVSLNLLLGVVTGVLASGANGILSSPMVELLIATQIGGVVAAISLARVQRRTTLLLAGVWTGLATGAAMIGIGLMTNLNINVTLKNAGFAAIGSLLSSVLTVGVLPLLESVFSIMTQQKLLELSNPNQPLLRMLQLEAPGTYHHALLVANLAEAAADAVGANDLLCRVGAYYHDIGKAKRPQYFKENQLDDVNPHDAMAPQVSAAILAEHVRDGRVMAEREKLPKAIVDIIEQHHGTTTMAYFLFRAKKLAEETGEEVLDEDYRYDGPTPQTKEAAIIFLADSVEAAVRSLKDHSSESIQSMIRKLIAERMQDGQLADVPLTLKDFSLMEHAFLRVLGGIYHTRVEYPELDKPKKEEKAL